MGSLLVVTGPPGSGKSTVSKLLVQQTGPSALVEGDRFFAFLARDAIEPWLPESHEQNAVVVDAAAAATGRFTDGGFFTVYDGVVGPWFIDAFASAAGATELDYVVLMPDVETCVERVLSRSGHGFRDEAAPGRCTPNSLRRWWSLATCSASARSRRPKLSTASRQRPKPATCGTH